MSAMLLAGCGTTSNDPDPLLPHHRPSRGGPPLRKAPISMICPGVVERGHHIPLMRDHEYQSTALPGDRLGYLASDDLPHLYFHLRDDAVQHGTALMLKAVVSFQ